MRLKLGGGQAYNRSTKCPYGREWDRHGIICSITPEITMGLYVL
jgi:hypothetical protein